MMGAMTVTVNECEESDDPNPPKREKREKPEWVVISIRFPAELVQETRALAQEQNRSFNGTVREALRRYVRQMKPRVPKEQEQ